MAKKIDQIIVVDLEATCWEDNPPPGEEQEIIEIGVCALDIASLERIKKRSFLIRPERSKVSDFCTQLTTITQAQLDEEGMPFADAVQRLRDEYTPQERTWASFGDFDRILFQRQCEARGVAYPFGRTHLNIKNLLGISHNLPFEISLERALEKFSIPMEGTLHRGGDDAWGIAAVLAAIFREVRSGGK